MKHAADIPVHQYLWVDKSILSRGQQTGWEECVWFGLLSVPHRAWACTLMLKCGAIYRGTPLSALAYSEKGKTESWSIADAQRWDCFGYNFQPIIYAYLRELDCDVWVANRKEWMRGHYLFTCEPYEDAYSLEPSQTKSHHFIALKNGRITCVPGNNVMWHENSFTKPQGKPDWLRVQTETWHAEEPGFDSVITEETA